MEIKYEIVPNDIIYFSKETAKSDSVVKLYTIILFTISIIYMLSDMIIGVISVYQNNGSITVGSFHIFPRLAVVFVVGALTYAVLMTYSKYAARKAQRITRGKNGVFCEHTIVINEDGFTETTEVNRSFQSWEGVEKIDETASYVAIYIKFGSGHIIPKRAFTDDAQIREFVAKVSTNITAANEQFPTADQTKPSP